TTPSTPSRAGSHVTILAASIPIGRLTAGSSRMRRFVARVARDANARVSFGRHVFGFAGAWSKNMTMVRFAACTALAAGACAPRADVALAPAGTPTAIVASDPARPPSGTLDLDGARRYMLELLNRDRASMGLSPVQLDDGPATHAAQAHAEDM